MVNFIRRFGSAVSGVLSGFDRVRIRGTKRLLASAKGMMSYLFQMNVLLKDFDRHAQGVTQQLREATVQKAKAADRPLVYLSNPGWSKEDRARKIAQQDQIKEGLVCILSSVEPCQSFQVYRNRENRQIELRPAVRKCLHYYHYFLHPQWGFMHARVQTWFPFTVHVCINGREWLVRQLEREGIGYRRRDNCLVAVEDVPGAQALLEQQRTTDWKPMLDAVAGTANPLEASLFDYCPVPYYWSMEESEWATDVLFRDAKELSSIYPGLIRHGITALGSRDIMRFLGHKVPTHGFGRFAGEVVSDLHERPEGIRLKHWVKGNSIKMYDKQGSVLRVETTINEPRCLKVFRPKEGDEEGAKSWRYMRKGIADVYRRAEHCQQANERYLEAIASSPAGQPLREVIEPLCRPTRWKKQRVRGLNPLSPQDAALLAAVGRGEFVLQGFRNRDLRSLLFGAEPADAAERRRQSGQVTRKIRMLRAHHLVRKSPHTQRYQLTEHGRQAITALLIAREADTSKLEAAA